MRMLTEGRREDGFWLREEEAMDAEGRMEAEGNMDAEGKMVVEGKMDAEGMMDAGCGRKGREMLEEGRWMLT
jgi:hypothetical protein